MKWLTSSESKNFAALGTAIGGGGGGDGPPKNGGSRSLICEHGRQCSTFSRLPNPQIFEGVVTWDAEPGCLHSHSESTPPRARAHANIQP